MHHSQFTIHSPGNWWELNWQKSWNIYEGIKNSACFWTSLSVTSSVWEPLNSTTKPRKNWIHKGDENRKCFKGWLHTSQYGTFSYGFSMQLKEKEAKLWQVNGQKPPSDTEHARVSEEENLLWADLPSVGGSLTRTLRLVRAVWNL